MFTSQMRQLGGAYSTTTIEKLNNNNDKDHIDTGKRVQKNEFAAINQGPVNDLTLHLLIVGFFELLSDKT